MEAVLELEQMTAGAGLERCWAELCQNEERNQLLPKHESQLDQEEQCYHERLGSARPAAGQRESGASSGRTPYIS